MHRKAFLAHSDARFRGVNRNERKAWPLGPARGDCADVLFRQFAERIPEVGGRGVGKLVRLHVTADARSEILFA